MEKIFDKVFSNYNEDWISFVDYLVNNLFK